MKLISLTQGKFAKVDDKDYEYLINLRKWFAVKGNHSYYAVCKLNGKRIAMHRLLLNYGPDDPMVDHKNGDGLDNQKHNLRPATPRENAYNSRPMKNKKTSKFKGVYWRTNRSCWAVKLSIGQDGHDKRKTIGHFKDELEAAKAYEQAVSIYYGEFAWKPQ